MSLSALVNGADCGPVNPLQGLSKRFDSDRGAQQDQYRPGRAGPSRDAFRSQPGQVSTDVIREASEFFQNKSASPVNAHTTTPFDLTSLHAALGPSPLLSNSPQITNATSGWAADFRNAHQAQVFQQAPVVASQINSASWAADFAGQTSIIPTTRNRVEPLGLQNSFSGLQPMYQSMPMVHGMQPYSYASPQAALSAVHNFSSETHSDWASHFNSIEAPQQSVSDQATTSTPSEILTDDLAATAGLLVDSLRHETNVKFKQSAFLGLMRQLRDKEMVVDGNDMVAASVAKSTDMTWANEIEGDIKGKGREVYPEGVHNPLAPAFGVGDTATLGIRTRSKSVHFQDTQRPIVVPSATSSDFEPWEDFEVSSSKGPQRTGIIAAQTAEWDRLQADWDAFEATSTGFRPALPAAYDFQHNNPYLLGQTSNTHHHARHAQRSTYQSVLEKEAAVQLNPFDAQAWYELGVKQQENEREHKAIEALRRAIELDPTSLSAWLALAVSYTNENNRVEAQEAISRWISQNEQYKIASARYLLNANRSQETQTQHHDRLIECLVDMARMAPEGQIDADIQIALAVLLNGSEDYEKAQDCFRTALEVRPDDWLLYNRVGATMANSGRAEEALAYYYRALELNPSYIRARFNLGISCINLQRYQEAASHILDALILQEEDNTEQPLTPDANGPSRQKAMSSALWDTLKTTSLHMHRHDLAALCEPGQRNLTRYQAEFQNTSQA